MVKSIFRPALAAAALVLAMAAASCRTAFTDSALDGTWISDDGGEELTLNKGAFQIAIAGDLLWKGTYTTGGGKIVMKTTAMYGATIELEQKWYSEEELRMALVFKGVPANEVHAELDILFSTETSEYSVTNAAGGAALTLKKEGQETNYAKT